MTIRIIALASLGSLAGLAMALPAAVPAELSAGVEDTDMAQPLPDVVAKGAEVFAQRCASCHSVEQGKPSFGGPNLAGIVGRQAGSGQYRYSSAMRDSGLIWTEQDLDTFLDAPTRKLPGTYMFAALKDAAQRKAVIAYLATTANERQPPR